MKQIENHEKNVKFQTIQKRNDMLISAGRVGTND
jgi:hypothetical protein